MLTVQSVQCHVAADCTGRTVIQLTWQAQLVVTDVAASGGDTWQGDWVRMLTWTGQVDQSGR
jgi:hypothetical protein